MQSDLGKLFIGGISWDTNEEGLKDYFSGYGEVLEAVIMKDRNTGRARGFGFVVFSDPLVVERVINEKHCIDGRMVEAKRAVPREDHQNSSNNPNNPMHGSPLQGGRTRKIFVGGLASSVTDEDFKAYFEQYGTITDVVVMYDHITHRPRGFGFITFDSEDAVDKVLLKTFHELNGKVVEVKRAVPKELSSGGGGSALNRGSPLSGYSYFSHLNRMNNFLDGYNSPGFSSGYGLRMDDGRLGSIGGGRSNVFGPFGSLNFESGLNPSLINDGSYGRGRGRGRGGGGGGGGGGMNHPWLNTNNTNRFANPIGYDGGIGGGSSFFSSASKNLWGGVNNNNNTGRLSFGVNSSGSIGGNLGNSGLNWGSSSQLTNQNGRNLLGHVGNLDYGLPVGGGSGGSGGSGGGGGGYDRLSSLGTTVGDTIPNVGYDGAFPDLYNSGNSIYGDSTWHTSNLEKQGSGTFDYELGNVGDGSDVQTKGSHGFVGGGYGLAKTQSNRG